MSEKNFAPSRAHSTPHRGAAGGKGGKTKRRWSAAQRAARSDAPGRRSGTPHRGQDAPGGARAHRDGAARSFRGHGAAGERREWQPREERGDRAGRSTRREWEPRERSGHAGREDARGTRREWQPRDGGGRSERGSAWDRRSSERGEGRDNGGRGARGSRREWEPRERNDRDRGGSGDRGYRGYRGEQNDRSGRDERGAWNDRGARNDRGERNGRGSWNERGADRGSRGDRDDRGTRRDRQPRDRNDRDRARSPRRYDDRAPRRDRADSGYRNDDRGARGGYRNDERGARGFDRGTRQARGSRPEHPYRDDRRDDRGTWEKHETHAPVEDVVLERLKAEAITADEAAGVTFGDLGLGGNIVRTLETLGAATPFPIQAATIPDVLAGKDVLGRGRTGSGKTIAFGAPVAERLMNLWHESGGAGGKRRIGRAPRALILAPTRELALQIDRTVQPIARSVGLFTTQIYGGVPQHRQVTALQRGVDIVIGTPGRIEDLIEQGRLDLSEVVVSVLDEADLMCDLGFLEPVQRILRRTVAGGQRLLFSATLDTGVASLVEEFLTDPAVHEVAGEDQASSTIDHHVLVIDHREKTAVIEELTAREGKTLVFTRTRSYAEDLADELEDAGIRTVTLHGDLNQSRRSRNLAKLSEGRVNVLVATDVAARGIHVDDIDLVVQADAPMEYKTYLHRSGRTGRAGKPGTVVTLVSRGRRRRIEELLQRAEIDAAFTQAAPGDGLLERLGVQG